MNDEAKLDAECAARNRQDNPVQHLEHLLRIGYTADSPVIKRFAAEHGLEELLTAAD